MTNFKVGNGETIVSIKLLDGVLYVCINHNNTSMKFDNSQMLTAVENIEYKEHFKDEYSAVFEFSNFELGIKFYSGFFLTPNENVIQHLRKVYINWQQAICA